MLVVGFCTGFCAKSYFLYLYVTYAFMHFVLHIALKALRHVQWDALLHIYASFTSVTTSPPPPSISPCTNV